MRALRTLLIGALIFSMPAYSFTVIDPTNLVQNIQQVRQTIQTVNQLKDQLRNAEKQLEGMTGNRGMRNLATDASRDYIPRDWRETLDGMGHGREMERMMSDIRKSLGDMGSAGLANAPEHVAASAEQSARYDLAAWGRATTMYNRANTRFDDLERLGDALNGASDQKAVLDLMARLQIETNMLLNELIRMQAEMIATDRERTLRVEQQTQHQYTRAMSSF